MTVQSAKSLAIAAMMAVVSTVQVAAQYVTRQPAASQPATKEQAPAATAKRVIVVSLEDRELALVVDGQVKKIYPVAVGKASTPSPVGTFTIERRVMNPAYTHDGVTVPPGPNNPVGSRWMGLSIRGYGIHGTNVPSSIGKAASHGCIRMAKHDLEELYPMVAGGDTVELIGERNEETAQLFDSGQKPAAAAAQASTQLAKAAPAVASPAAQQTSSAPAATSSLTGASLETLVGLTLTGSM